MPDTTESFTFTFTRADGREGHVYLQIKGDEVENLSAAWPA